MTILLFFYGTMEKLEQGHLNPKLEVPRLTCLRWESNPGLHGAWRGAKLFLNSFIIAIWNIYIWARDIAPPVHMEHTYMNTHELL